MLFPSLLFLKSKFSTFKYAKCMHCWQRVPHARTGLMLVYGQVEFLPCEIRFSWYCSSYQVVFGKSWLKHRFTTSLRLMCFFFFKKKQYNGTMHFQEKIHMKNHQNRWGSPIIQSVLAGFWFYLAKSWLSLITCLLLGIFSLLVGSPLWWTGELLQNKRLFHSMHALQSGIRSFCLTNWLFPSADC